jgi:hypothetical protein
MEMVLLGTGGCTAYDVVLILKRGRQDVRGCSVKLEAERAETDPKVFTKINFHFTVTGRNLDPARSNARSSCRTRSTARRRSCWPRRPRSRTRRKSSKADRLRAAGQTKNARRNAGRSRI